MCYEKTLIAHEQPMCKLLKILLILFKVKSFFLTPPPPPSERPQYAPTNGRI
jgi:hypothetical protein